MKYYILTKDLEIGYIDSICTCEECKKRGNVELTINNIDGLFMLQTTIKDILSKNEVIAVSNDIEKLKNIKVILKKSDFYLCEALEKELLKRH